MTPRVAVVGAGWAGLSAAVQAARRGWPVTVFEASRSPGGRARTVRLADGGRFDNGQHILIGAYRECLALMRAVGVDPGQVLHRTTLQWRYPDGRGLALPTGAPAWAFVAGVLRARGWRLSDRLQLLRTAAAWRWSGFRCAPHATVADIASRLPAPVRRDFIEPLCVAALNTPASAASASVFLHVLREALFGGPGSADLLLPRRGLSELLPDAAADWLARQGAPVRTGLRVTELERSAGSPQAPNGTGWCLLGEPFDRVILACGPAAAARLAEPFDADWSAEQRRLPQRAILTVWLESPGARLASPMVALESGANHPAQFVFDLAALGHPDACFAFVASAADDALGDGVDAAAAMVLEQARRAFPGRFDHARVRHAAAERRAAFSCEPGVHRSRQRIDAGLWAAGDHLSGPYPATLEGAVLSGRMAVDAIAAELASQPRDARA